MAKKTSTNLLLPIGLLFFGFFYVRNKKSKVSGIGLITKFFNVTSDTTIDDLKKQYYKLAKIHHPDTGGSNESFRDMNNEYESLQNHILTNGNFSSFERKNEESISEIYREIIDSIISIQGIVIELIGTWIWISGNTFPVKEQIKAAGFKFHSKKSMWFWYPGEYKKFNNQEMDIENIRKKYGSNEIKSKITDKSLAGISSLGDKLVKLQGLLMQRELLNTDNSN